MTSSKNVVNNPDSDEVSIWDLPIVGEGDTPTIVVNAETMLPTAADIQKIQEDAYREAYDAAYEKAKNEGYEEGKKSGHEEGFESGKNEGFNQGIEEGRSVIEDKSQRLDSLIKHLSSPLGEIDLRVEEELMTLAMSVARHLVRRELKADPAHVISVVRQVVETLPISTQNIRIMLHPEDASLVRETLNVSDDEHQRWKIIEDPVLTRGGCNVETDYSRIDATVESRINSVVAQVFGGQRETDSVMLTEAVDSSEFVDSEHVEQSEMIDQIEDTKEASQETGNEPE